MPAAPVVASFSHPPASHDGWFEESFRSYTSSMAHSYFPWYSKWSLQEILCCI